MNAELGTISCQSIFVAFLLCNGEKLVFARLQVEKYGKVMAADRSVGVGIESVLTEQILAVLIVHHDNNASNMVVEKVGALRVVVIAEVQVDAIVAWLKVVVHQRARSQQWCKGEE